jgi:hypothetical protein
VEVIHMTATPDGHDGESFRVTHHGCWIGYARSVPELERWIELTDLEDALVLAVAPALSPAGKSARRER